MKHINRGVCSRSVEFDVVDNKIVGAHFNGGCNGNTQGVCRLVEGMDVDEAISRMKGIDCNGRGTSCPDQFAQALEMYKRGELK